MKRRAAMAALAALAALGALASCAIGPGEAFGTLEATLDGRLEVPADRALDDGFQKLASDWQVRVVRFDLVVDAVLVEAVQASDGAGADVTGADGDPGFDPAAPPPGYGLCHGGHCHSDDGRLVPYEEIAAELAGGGGGTQVAAAFTIGTLPLSPGGTRALECGACTLEPGRLRRVRLIASQLQLELEVRDGRSAPRIAGTRTARGTIDLGAADDGEDRAPGELVAILDVTVGDDEPRVVALDLALAPSVALLDAVDFAALPDAGGLLDLAAAEGALRASFQTLELGAHVARRDD